MVVLAGALVWVVAGTLDTPVVNAGDDAPKFNVVTEDGKTVTPHRLRRQTAGAEFLGELVRAVHRGDAFAGRDVAAARAERAWWCWASAWTPTRRAIRISSPALRISFETSRDPSADIATSYGTLQFPDTYIIDSHGKVRGEGHQLAGLDEARSPGRPAEDAVTAAAPIP